MWTKEIFWIEIFRVQQNRTRVWLSVGDKYCGVIEFPVDESRTAGCGQYSPGRRVLPRSRPAQLSAQSECVCPRPGSIFHLLAGVSKILNHVEKCNL